MNSPYPPQDLSATRRPSGDLRLPGMVYAAVGTLGQPLSQIDQHMSAARQTPGVLHVLPYSAAELDERRVGQEGVAVVSRGYWIARQKFDQLLEQCGAVSRQASPGSMAVCTVQWYRGQLRLWATVHDRLAFLSVASRLAGIALDQIELFPNPKSTETTDVAVLVPAIALARQLQPVAVQVLVGADLGAYCRVPPAVHCNDQAASSALAWVMTPPPKQTSPS
jgi:hypothetical protein